MKTNCIVCTLISIIVAIFVAILIFFLNNIIFYPNIRIPVDKDGVSSIKIIKRQIIEVSGTPAAKHFLEEVE